MRAKQPCNNVACPNAAKYCHVHAPMTCERVHADSDRRLALESLRAELAARPCEKPKYTMEGLGVSCGKYVDCGECAPCKARSLGKEVGA